MLLDFDTLIFTGFLALNLVVGLFYSRDVKTLKEYAIGTRNFSTSAVTTTIIATYIGAGFFTSVLAESYRDGLYFIIPVLGEPVAIIIMGYFFVPRMIEFLGDASVAETMGRFYGLTVRIITALAGIFTCSGIVALQFTVATSVMQIFFNVSSLYALILSAAVVILYSSFGGIKAVTFTDMLQFMTFAIILPFIALIIWKESNIEKIWEIFNYNPLFNYKEVFNIDNPRFIATISLFIFFIIPTFDPAYIQRVSMSRNIEQSKKGFIIGGCLCFIMLLIVCGVSILILSSNPNLNPDRLLPHIIENFTHVGLKGLAAVCVMAVIMSTADSYINAASVLLSNDIIGVINPKFTHQKEIIVIRLVALIVGISAFIISYNASSLFQILVLSINFYMPVAIVPLVLAIFGFRCSSVAVLIGMFAGIITVVLWPDLYNNLYLHNNIIPAMLANLIAMMIAHWIYGKPLSALSAKHTRALEYISKQRSQAYSNFINRIRNFNLIRFCMNNLLEHDYYYLLAGILSFMSTFYAAFWVFPKNQNLFSQVIYIGSLICSFLIMTYITWPSRFKAGKFMAIFWTITAPYIFVFVPTMFLVMSAFAQIPFAIFITNLIILTILIRWQVSLLMIMGASYLSIKLYNLLDLTYSLQNDQWQQFKIIYVLLSLSWIIIAFIKPKQEAVAISEEKIDHLSHTIEELEKEKRYLSDIKKIFLRNLQHETNTPLTGIYSMSQSLSDCYNKLSEKQRKNAIDFIKTNSERLVSYVHNLVDVSKLMTQKFKLDIHNVHISRLLEEAVQKCLRLYVNNQDEEDREIKLDIEPHIKIKGDEYLIQRSFENLIINAIQYCKKGLIDIILYKEGEKVIVKIKDSGIGVPKEELSDIFEPFTASSRTTTPAGGRGLGLAIVKEVASLHKGSVIVESDSSGSCFTMIITSLP